MSNKALKIIPVFRPESESLFVSPRYVKPTIVEVGGEKIETAPFALEKHISLLGISQTEKLLADQVLDRTDTTLPDISIESLYVTSGQTVLRIDPPEGMASFKPSPYSDNRHILEFDGRNFRFPISSDTTIVKGEVSDLLAALRQEGCLYSVAFNIAGAVNLELADVYLSGEGTVLNCRLESGEPANRARGGDVYAAVKSLRVIGYTLRAFRGQI